VSTSGYYAWRQRPVSKHARADEALLRLIGVLFDRLQGNPGVRRMHAELVSQGHRVARKRVWRLMKAAGLQGRHPRAWKKTTIHGERPVPAPDLIGRDFTAKKRDQRWCGDITYIKSWDGWVYLATVIDLHSRRVVGWAVADHMRTELVTDALTMALKQRPFRSRDTIYVARFRDVLPEEQDSSFVGPDGYLLRQCGRGEFLRVVQEGAHPHPAFEWIEMYYNRARRHSTLGYLTPHEYELGFRHIHELAA